MISDKIYYSVNENSIVPTANKPYSKHSAVQTLELLLQKNTTHPKLVLDVAKKIQEKFEESLKKLHFFSRFIFKVRTYLGFGDGAKVQSLFHQITAKHSTDNETVRGHKESTAYGHASATATPLKDSNTCDIFHPVGHELHKANRDTGPSTRFSPTKTASNSDTDVSEDQSSKPYDKKAELPQIFSDQANRSSESSTHGEIYHPPGHQNHTANRNKGPSTRFPIPNPKAI